MINFLFNLTTENLPKASSNGILGYVSLFIAMAIIYLAIILMNKFLKEKNK